MSNCKQEDRTSRNRRPTQYKDPIAGYSADGDCLLTLIVIFTVAAIFLLPALLSENLNNQSTKGDIPCEPLTAPLLKD